MSIKVMVADTAHLHIYSMAKARAKLEKIATFANPFAIKHERDAGADKPGRGMSRAAGRRTALEGRTTLKQQAADQFARMVAKTASAAVRDAETIKRFAGAGVDLIGGSVEDSNKYLQAEMTKWSKVIREAGIKAD